MEEKPRYSRVSDIIQLIVLMLSKLNGVSLQDIQDEFKVSRRTAERMRDSILAIMPQVDEIETEGRTKRWGFTNYSLNEVITFDADNVALLEKIKPACDELSAQELQNIITKIKALSVKKAVNLEDEIEFILRSEGYAIKQAPNYKIDLDTISTIRQAIKQGKKLTATYNGKKKVLSPLGLIYGEKIHLVAREEKKGFDPYNYLLHKLSCVQTTNEDFKSHDFDIKKYAEKSFGVYQGEIYDVKLKFLPEVAEDAKHYNFHPTQKVKPQEDGSVIVTFKASGEYHIIWNLFKWGTGVEIISPKSLKKEYKEYLQNVLKGM